MRNALAGGRWPTRPDRSRTPVVNEPNNLFTRKPPYFVSAVSCPDDPASGPRVSGSDSQPESLPALPGWIRAGSTLRRSKLFGKPIYSVRQPPSSGTRRRCGGERILQPHSSPLATHSIPADSLSHPPSGASAVPGIPRRAVKSSSIFIIILFVSG